MHIKITVEGRQPWTWTLSTHMSMYVCSMCTCTTCAMCYIHSYIDYFTYIRGCIYTPPVLVGLWLGSVEIQQAIYSAYEFVTCYDRCMYSCINVRVHMMYLCPKMRKPKSEVDRILKAPSHPLFQVFLEPHIA